MKQETSPRPVAIVTGASMGIGEGLAERLASRFHDLVLVARSGENLERIAARVRERYGVQTEVLAEDLSEPHSTERVAQTALRRFDRIDLLVNNAGFGRHGAFTQSDPAEMRRMIEVNAAAVVDLTYRCLPSIAQRGGGIINVASTAAFQPVPYMAVYGATKAFVLSFSEALHEELAGRGVRVLAVCPGATKTNFFRTAGEAAQVGTARAIDDVVNTTMDAYDRGAMTVVDGRLNRLLSVVPRLLPRRFVAGVAAGMMKP
jgi:short-subunit dehydrogenase